MQHKGFPMKDKIVITITGPRCQDVKMEWDGVDMTKIGIVSIDFHAEVDGLNEILLKFVPGAKEELERQAEEKETELRSLGYRPQEKE